MQIILNTLQDPTDQVLQGRTIGDTPLGAQLDPWPSGMVLPGEEPLGNMTGAAVPRAMIGWNPYTPQAAAIGPMATQGGVVGMVPIGPAVAVSPIIDPTQQFLFSALPLDATGMYFPNDDVLGSFAEPSWSGVLQGEAPLTAPPLPANPRGEIARSGLLKVITKTEVSATFGWKVYETQLSYQSFTLNGTTVDGSGAALANCRVIAYQSGWIYVAQGTETIAETVSDGSGAFSLTLRNIDYQLVAYKAGTPDKAGITRNDVTPLIAPTIYLRDPTVADAASSAAYRPIGSPVVRRISE